MKRTIIDNFEPRIKDGQLIISQRGTDIFVATEVIYDMIDDTTEDEQNILYEAVKILKKYDK